MKPNEFDELIRQKFDQNDFEYNPGNWEQLEEQLDGRARKRMIMIWWWAPLAGIAASVALAMGMLTMWQPGGAADKSAGNQMAKNTISVQAAPLPDQPFSAQESTPVANTIQHSKPVASHRKSIVQKKESVPDFVAITLHDAPADTKTKRNVTIDLLSIGNTLPADNTKKKTIVNEGFPTFKPEEEVQKVPKLLVIVSGGINRGNQNNGYMAGATIRKMLNDRVYIEGDVAYANSNNTQAEGVLLPAAASASAARHGGMAAKFSSDESSKAVTSDGNTGTIVQQNVTYNLSYAQVTPGIGYKLMKKMSIGVGPDFQQMLADNRPVAAAGYRGNIQEAPSFDVGFVGKSEYALTKKIKAGVYYRKGINSVISLNDKYIDRDYLQFQLKCTIFNK